MARTIRTLAVILVMSGTLPARAADPPPASAPGSAAEKVEAWLKQAEVELLKLAIEQGQADWVQQNFITEDTDAIVSLANERLASAQVRLAKVAAKHESVAGLSPAVARRLRLLKLGIALPVPSGPGESEELARVAADMQSAYGRGKWCHPGKDGKEECLGISALGRLLATGRDPAVLKDAWVGWHAVGATMRPDFDRYVELGNRGAEELGFADMGTMWRSRYDMAPDAFEKDLLRLWQQVRPLYVSLHAYVRRKLREQYGPEVVPEKGPIPAHLLGNMWAQEWSNVYPLAAPKGADPGYDLTERLQAKKVDAVEMVKIGERFFTSLGFAPMPETFWRRSLFVKPADRDVVCHASAWDLDYVDDLRIKMCIQINDEDFQTIHHELGHNFYQRAYNQQPFLFRDSANDGFHEAIGDAVALSITPRYLRQTGFIDSEPDTSKDIGLLLRMAMDKVAFLPFGLVIDQWRWKVFAGQVKPAEMNQAWWDMRRELQGVAPPQARTAQDFDPAAKYHVPANVPYTRYFLAHILQFQFHRAMCRQAGDPGPLNRCSIYGNKEVGAKLDAMLQMGVSQPWPDALQALTGERQVDAGALLEYFAPLQKWLDEQNQGHPVGW